MAKTPAWQRKAGKNPKGGLNVNLLEKWKTGQKLVDQFWNSWSKEYFVVPPKVNNLKI